MVQRESAGKASHFSSGEVFAMVREAIEDAANFELPGPVRPKDSLVNDLGFDSLTISLLALELEQRLGRPILLNRWVEGVNRPAQLTVASLCDYLQEFL